MAAYLIKVTLIWTLLLALYELLYKKSPAFTLNRIYLLLALVAGMLLPLMPLPGFNVMASGIGGASKSIQDLNQAVTPAATPATAGDPGFDWGLLLKGLYLSGACLALAISLREVVLIIRTAVYGTYEIVAAHRIFSSSKPHAPFSFMGWVFISDPTLYDEDGLNYILKHEAAHNSRKHWLDMILMQLVFTLFWFHPLVWRFRYLLKLSHEYEADQYAAGGNAYEYGHFLLQQTLLKGTPSIAHSFHFSPIKNRIFMLTQTRKKWSWKYVIVLPALLTCGLLFAKSNGNGQRVRVGDKTVFNGHEFLWSKQMMDTMSVENPATGEIRKLVHTREGSIYSMDGDSLYINEEDRLTQAQFRFNNTDFRNYLMPILKKGGNLPDSIKMISLSNIVIDESGKLQYYDIDCIAGNGNYKSFHKLSDPASPLHQYGQYIDKEIAGSPAWLPALMGNSKVKVRLRDQYTIYVNMPESK